jgi:hypothetical protein
MDILLLVIPFCLAFEFFYLIRVRWKPPLSRKGKLIAGLSGIAAIVTFILLVTHYDRLNPRANGIYLPTLGVMLKGWGIAATLLIGVLENLILAIIAIANCLSPTLKPCEVSSFETRPSSVFAKIQENTEVNDSNLIVKLEGRGMLTDLEIILFLDKVKIASGSIVKGFEVNLSISQGLHNIYVGASESGKTLSKVVTFAAESGKNITITFDYSCVWGNYQAIIAGA